MADNDPAADHLWVDVDAVQSLAAFARACDRLRAGRSYAELDRAARPRSLPAATLNNLLNAKGIPTRDTVIKFLVACGLTDATAQAPWLAALERVATAHQPRPDGAVRVREARPRLLGVHAALQVEDTHGELPPYVPRDLDVDLRTAITAAAARGGLVLMVGGSSVGKTRALYEAVRTALPEWWLLHPADIPTIGAHAVAPTPRTVLWLDELQRHLSHPAGLTLGVLHRLITVGTVVVATLWPDEYSRRTVRPIGGQPDPHAEDRDILRLAHIVRVPDRFSAAERRRGEALAGTDQRIRIALDTNDAGFTQVLAAGPALIQRWETAEDCYGQAFVTAALDARRVGAQHPVTPDFLNAAAPAYLTPTQQATAPPNWLEQALAYATTPVHGASACLNPAPAGMGQIGGYTAADYLHQHAQRTLRRVPVPAAAWQALVENHHPDDAAGIAASAAKRGMYKIAATVGGRSIQEYLPRQPDPTGLGELPQMTPEGDPDELIRQGDTISWARLMFARAEGAELGRRAAGGDEASRRWFANLLARAGDVEALRALSESGDPAARRRIAGFAVTCGDFSMLRKMVDAPAPACWEAIATLLSDRGDVDELIQWRYTGDRFAVDRLDHLQTFDYDLPFPRTVKPGDIFAAWWLAETLANRGELDELRSWADAGSSSAKSVLDNRASAGDPDELRRDFQRGREGALWQLCASLYYAGDSKGLWELIRRGEQSAHLPLAILLAARADAEELAQLADLDRGYQIGGNVDRGPFLSARGRLATLLLARGDLEGLRRRSSRGEHDAEIMFIRALHARRDIEALEAEVHGGSELATEMLLLLTTRSMPWSGLFGLTADAKPERLSDPVDRVAPVGTI